MTETVRWNIDVSKETDRNVRRLLGGKRRSAREIARFIEEMVENRLFDELVAENEARNTDLSDEEIQALADEAVDAVRAEMWGTPKINAL